MSKTNDSRLKEQRKVEASLLAELSIVEIDTGLPFYLQASVGFTVFTIPPLHVEISVSLLQFADKFE